MIFKKSQCLFLLVLILVSFVNESFAAINITKKYSIKEFENNMQKILVLAFPDIDCEVKFNKYENNNFKFEINLPIDVDPSYCHEIAPDLSDILTKTFFNVLKEDYSIDLNKEWIFFSVWIHHEKMTLKGLKKSVIGRRYYDFNIGESTWEFRDF